MHLSRFAPCLILLAACATSYTPRGNSREDLVSYVDRAAQLVAREGTAACATLGQSRWTSGDWYVFVNDVDRDTVVCHPTLPAGQNMAEVRDANGKYLTREMKAAVAGAGGRGWVDYVWPRPGQTQPEPKTAYVVAVTGPDGKRYLVGSGGYNMAAP